MTKDGNRDGSRSARFGFTDCELMIAGLVSKVQGAELTTQIAKCGLSVFGSEIKDRVGTWVTLSSGAMGSAL